MSSDLLAKSTLAAALSQDEEVRPRILIVDDSYMVAEMLSNFLGEQGCAITYALDGLTALKMMSKEPPDMVIADWVMPDLDGLELCRRLRQSPELSWIYFITMTAREGTDNMERALEAGSDEFLAKPFQAAELMARVRAGLRIVQQRRLQMQPPPTAVRPTSTPIGSRQNLAAKLPQTIATARARQRALGLFIIRWANLHSLSPEAEQQRGWSKQFAEHLAAALRDGDSLFCYTENQFIGILAGANLLGAQVAAERCCQRLLSSDLAISDHLPLHLQWGIATLTSEDDAQGVSLLRRAAQTLHDTSATTDAAEALDPRVDLVGEMRQLQAENQQLRAQLDRFAKLEAENKQLRQKLQHVVTLLQKSKASSS